MIVAADADLAEPAAPAIVMADIKNGKRCNRIGYRMLDISEPITKAARNPEARPACYRLYRRGDLGVGAGRHVGGESRGGECRNRGQGEH